MHWGRRSVKGCAVQSIDAVGQAWKTSSDRDYRESREFVPGNGIDRCAVVIADVLEQACVAYVKSCASRRDLNFHQHRRQELHVQLARVAPALYPCSGIAGWWDFL